ncbi:MAG: T9SS type A sorting domain-containing protein [Vicingus serpentipes]|nr:T9SS type A sorting domain-containing protein [Vicingus serpentipes]
MKRYLLILLTTFVTTHIYSQCALQNADFEIWGVATVNLFPSGTTTKDTLDGGWVSFTDAFGVPFGNPPVLLKSTDKYQGNYAVELKAPVAGSADLIGMGICNSQPDRMQGYYKFSGSGNDSLAIYVFLTDDDPMNFLVNGDSSTADGYGQFITQQTKSTYTLFDIPINYKNAKTALNVIILVNVNNHNSGDISAHLDDFSLSTPVGISDIITDNTIQLYPNPTQGELHLNGNLQDVQSIHVTDVRGINVLNVSKLELSSTINVAALAKGVYVMQVVGQSDTSFMKFVVQ